MLTSAQLDKDAIDQDGEHVGDQFDVDGDRVRVKRFRRHQEIEESSEVNNTKCCAKKKKEQIKREVDTFEDPDVNLEIEAV